MLIVAALPDKEDTSLDFKFIAKEDRGKIDPQRLCAVVTLWFETRHQYYGDFGIKYIKAQDFYRIKEVDVTKDLYTFWDLDRYLMVNVKRKSV